MMSQPTTNVITRNLLLACLLAGLFAFARQEVVAQLTLTGVSIPGVGSFIDASEYPVLRVRFRATRAGQPVTLRSTDVYILEVNAYKGVSKLIEESNGTYIAEYATSQFNPVLNSIPTTVSGGIFLYAVNNGDVGSLPVTWNLAPDRGGSVFVMDSSFKRVPLYIDFGDVPVGVDSMRKLNVRAFEATRAANGNERNLRIDTIMTKTNNFRIVWKGSYGTKPPPVSVEAGGDYRFDLYCSPKATGPISDVLTVVYEGGARFDVMVFANAPSYKATTVLQVTSPNGGENLTPCQSVNIRWTGAIQGFHTHAEYTTDNGRSWKFIDSTLDSVIVWRIPSEYSDSARIRVYQKQGASGARWLRGLAQSATNLAFSANGRFLAVAYADGTIAEWDIVSSTIVNTYVADGVVAPATKISGLAFVGRSRNILAVIDRQSPAKDQLQHFTLGNTSPDARMDVDLPNVIEIGTDSLGLSAFAVGTMGGRIRVYDAATLIEQAPILLSSPSAAAKLADNVLTVAQIDGMVVRIDPSTKNEISRYATDLPNAGGPAPNFVGLSRTTRLIALAGIANPGAGNNPQEQRTMIYDTQAETLIRVVYREGSNSVGLTFNPSETFLTLGFAGQPQVQQYDILNRTMAGPIANMPGHGDIMTDIEYGPDGSTLASCSVDKQDNLLLRRIITPENDMSDGVFRILPLDLSSVTITMGTRYIGTNLDTTVTATICNNGIVPAVFESGVLFAGSWLTLNETIANDTLPPGQCLSVRFTAMPRDTGLLVDSLILSACSVRFAVPVIVRSIDRDLTLGGDMTDFGNICVGDTSVRSVPLVRNNDPIGVTIDGIAMRKGVASQFRVRGYTPGATLASGATLNVEILFVPRTAGRDTDEVVITYAGQISVTRSIRVTGYGSGADIALSHPVLAFIPEITERDVVLANRSSNDVVLGSAVVNAGAPFTLLTPVPITIRGNDSIVLRVRYDGGVIGVNDALALAFTPCASSLNIKLAAYTGSSTITAPTVSADPRGDVVIPITATTVESITYNGQRTFEGTMQVNPRLFIARSINSDLGPTEIVSQDIIGGLRHVRFRVTGSYSRTQEIARLVGPAGLAEIDSSELTFDSTAIAYGSAVSMTYEKGLLRILNPDPNRHILHPSALAITSVSPQPASDDVRVTVVTDLDGLATFTLSDQQGVVHRARQVQLTRGTTDLMIDTHDLPPGVHMILLHVGTNITSSSVVVIR
ncbi:MAG: choice-of-anchor D domain-containing protein [Ignavibacteria bacterium]|nr:choice-of-anchor D domain-containing protein [Ignavibacteria bacterium]